MSYIGTPPSNAFTSLLKQDFSTSATTGYTLDHAVNNANDIALFINFVRQEPTAGYAASGTSLVLTSATASSDDMYCVYLGQALQTVNPANASVGSTQLSPTAITGQTALTSVASDDTVLISDTSASGALKKMTRANFVSGIGGTNTPAFEARLASNQVISNNTFTKALIATEIYDSDGKFASNRFTPTVVGKYFVYGSAKLQTTVSEFQLGVVAIYKNGSIYLERELDFRNNPGHLGNVDVFATIDMDADDYVELYIKIYKTGGTDIQANYSNKGTTFGAYKIIT